MALKIFNHQKYLDRLSLALQKDKESGLAGKDLHNAFQANSILALVAQLDEDIAAALEKMEARIDAIESRGIKYCGVHQRALDYKQGDVVTHKGGMWICLRSNNETPGNSDAWQLALKGA